MNWSRLTRHPGICAGAPTLKGSRVSVDVIASRFVSGESIGQLAEDYDVWVPDIAEALRFVLYANGVSLGSQRAQERIARVLPEER